MSHIATVVYDGQVLRPEQPLNLEPNQRYIITLEPVPNPQTAWDLLKDSAGSLEMPSDWSEEHDHYLYGTPKQENQVDEP